MKIGELLDMVRSDISERVSIIEDVRSEGYAVPVYEGEAVSVPDRLRELEVDHIAPSKFMLDVHYSRQDRRRRPGDWQVDVCYFDDDGEEREWCWSYCVTCGLAYEDARDFARDLAFNDTLRRIVSYIGYDGVSVDVKRMPDPEPHAYELSYEYMASTGAVERWCAED